MTATDLAAYRSMAVCDMCHQPILAEEAHTEDPHGETTHDACVKDWFRRNYGKEDLA